jgi:hypothetical protein
VRLGILGLGRNWQSLRNALRRSKLWTVAIVFDQVHHLATQAALPLGAKVAESVWQFLSWSGVDAFIYCDSQWFGLWPLEVALQIPQHAEESGASSRMGLQVEHTTNESRTPATHYRPWLCYVPPSVLDAADQRILTRLAEVGFPIFFDWPEWHTLPLATLKKRVRHRLGRLLWASAECFARPNALGYPSLSQSSASQRWHTWWLSGLNMLTQLTGSTAELLQTHVYRFDHETGVGIVHLALKTSEHQTPAQIRVVETPDADIPRFADRSNRDAAIQRARAWQLRLIGENGELVIHGPGYLEWRTSRGRTLETCPHQRSPWRISLRRFHRHVQRGDWQQAPLLDLARYCQQLAQLSS